MDNDVKDKVEEVKKDSTQGYSQPQVCKILGITRQQFYQLIGTGKLKAFNIGVGKVRKRYRVHKIDLIDFMTKK